MKILLAVGPKEGIGPTKDLDPAAIRETSMVYNYFLRHEFDRIPGVRTETVNLAFADEEEGAKRVLSSVEIPACDHFIYLQQRAFTHTHPMIYEAVRQRTKGKVCVICDHDLAYGPEDILFHVQPSKRTDGATKSVKTTWAASPHFCFPEKEPGVLNFLIDHRGYVPPQKDRSLDVAAEIVRFAREIFPTEGPKRGFTRLVVRRLISNGMEIVDTSRDPYTEESYNRKSLTFPDVCREYRRANAFFGTHIESMGLSYLETGMAGGLGVYIENYVPSNLIGALNSLGWTDRIDWDMLFEKLDMGRSVLAAAPFNWQTVATMMHGTLRA